VYFHFILFLIGSVFFVVLNKIINLKPEYDWFIWAICIWLVLLTIHFINVFVMNRFFGKEWVKIQTEKLVSKHQVELEKLENNLEKEGDFTSDSSEEEHNS
jgi:hypothetical protein